MICIHGCREKRGCDTTLETGEFGPGLAAIAGVALHARFHDLPQGLRFRRWLVSAGNLGKPMESVRILALLQEY
jgi:hypothetical protein